MSLAIYKLFASTVAAGTVGSSLLVDYGDVVGKVADVVVLLAVRDLAVDLRSHGQDPAAGAAVVYL